MVQALLTLMLLIPLYVSAQTRVIQGEVLDKQSDEPIPFVSVRFAVQGGGMLTDSLGKFSIVLNAKKKKGTSHSKSKSTISKKNYKDMQDN